MQERAADVIDGDVLRRGGADRVRQLEEAARAARRSNDLVTARRHFEAAIDLLGAEQPSWQSRLRIQLSRLLMLSGDPDASLWHAEAGLASAADPPTRAMALARLGVCLVHHGRPNEARTAAREAIKTATSVRDAEAEGMARMSLGWALRSAGDLGGAAAEFRKASRLGEAIEDHEAVVARLIDLANTLYLHGDGGGAVRASWRAIGAARRGGVSLGMARASAADQEYRLGQWPTALRLVDDGLLEEPDLVWLHLVRARLMIGRGDLDGARHHLQRSDAVRYAPRSGGWVGPHEVVAELALWDRQPAAAREQVREALAAIRGLDRAVSARELILLGLRAAADLRATTDGQPEDSTWLGFAGGLLDLMRRHASLMRRNGGPSRTGARVQADEAMAEAEYARAVHGPSSHLWERAATSFEALSDVWTAAYARYRHAAAVTREGGPLADAAASANAAYRAAVRLEAGLLRRQVETLATEAGIPLAPDAAARVTDVVTPRDPAGLTRREREVLGLLAHGYTNRRMARALGISEKTVSVHIGRVTEKLGVENRLEAAAMAIRLEAGAAEPTEHRDRGIGRFS